MLTLFNRSNLLPVAGGSELHRQFDRFLEDAFSPPFRGWAEGASATWIPRADVEETETHFLISVDVPGVPKEGIQLEAKDGLLRVSAERKGSPGRSGKWERLFTLPRDIQHEKIEASCQDGVLRIALPKAEAAKARTIQIQDGPLSTFDKSA